MGRSTYSDERGVIDLRLHGVRRALNLILLLRVEPALLNSRPDAPDVLLHVLPIKLCSLGVGGAVRVRVVQEGLDGREDRGDVVGGRPAVLEDVEAQLAVRVDVRVEHAREELDGWRLVGVGLVEGEQELEGAVFEGRLGWIVEIDKRGPEDEREDGGESALSLCRSTRA